MYVEWQGGPYDGLVIQVPDDTSTVIVLLPLNFDYWKENWEPVTQKEIHCPIRKLWNGKRVVQWPYV